MNIADGLRKNFLFCSAGFIPFPDAQTYAECRIADEDGDIEDSEDEVHREGSAAHYQAHVQLSPAQQAVIASHRWHIDAASFGTDYHGAPVFLGPLAPSHINVCLPDQLEWPPDTWRMLGAHESSRVVGASVRRLGIVPHLQRALAYWASTVSDFAERYRNLPFGSEIVVNNVDVDFERMSIEFCPKPRLFHRLLSVAALSDLWRDESLCLPETVIDYHELVYAEQAAEHVSFVTWKGRKAVFKAKSPSYLYHELKTLLKLPPHPDITKAPLALVTTRGEAAQQPPRVCGLLFERYESGTLFASLSQRAANGTLTIAHQARWASELARVIQHINSVPANFYSDLRMDIIMFNCESEGEEHIVLIDFEQSRNIYNWAPPEMYYLEWLAELAYEDFDRSDGEIPEDVRARCMKILERFLALRHYPTPLRRAPSHYENAPHGWYHPWLISSPSEKEAGQVYLLGRALWCLFEGLGEADIILGRSTHDDNLLWQRRFPQFHCTPVRIQKLIAKCTAGAREWEDGPIKIVRRASTIYPLGRTGINGKLKASLDETRAAITSFWQNEVEKAERFYLAKIHDEMDNTTADDRLLLQYRCRPTLAEVVRELEDFERSVS